MRIIIEDETRKQEQTSLEGEKIINDAGPAPSSFVTSARIEPIYTTEPTVNASNIDAGPVPQSLIDSIQGTIPPTKTINNEFEGNAGAASQF